MISLKDLSIINKHSKNCRLYYYSVTDSLFSRFNGLYRKLLLAIGAAVETRVYAKLDYQLKKIKYQLSTQPIPYNYIVTSDIIQSIQNSIYEGIKLNPEHRRLLQDLFESIKEIGSHSSSALIDCLKQKILKHSSFSYCIVTKRGINLINKEYLNNLFSDYDIKFMDEKSYKDELSIFDYAIFMGNESYFHHSFNNNKRSKIVSFISRDCYSNDHAENSLFIHWQAPKISTMYKNVLEEKVVHNYTTEITFLEENNETMEELAIEKEDSIQEPEISLSIMDNILQNLIESQIKTHYIETEDMIKARLFELQGEKAIFIRDSRGLQDVITDQGIFIRKISSEIVVGDSLVLNSLSDSKLLEDFADKLFEKQNIELHRKRQATLQKYIAKLVDKYSIPVLCKKLKTKGLSKINESKIKNMLKSTSFKLKNNEEYLHFLLILTKGDEKKARKFYATSRRLSAYHIQAGRKIRVILRDNLEKTDLTKLLASGEQFVELHDMPGITLEIRKVVTVGNKVMDIPAVHEKRLIDF